LFEVSAGRVSSFSAKAGICTAEGRRAFPQRGEIERPQLIEGLWERRYPDPTHPDALGLTSEMAFGQR